MKTKDIENIVLSNEEKIKLFFNRYVYNKDDVEDLIQDTICSIISSVDTFKGKSSIETWIYSICRNVLYTYIHKKQKQKQLKQKIDKYFYEDDKNKIEIRMLIDKLPSTLKQLYDLFYVKQYSIKEISKLQKKPIGTIK